MMKRRAMIAIDANGVPGLSRTGRRGWTKVEGAVTADNYLTAGDAGDERRATWGGDGGRREAGDVGRERRGLRGSPNLLI
jgi:hypothetical protein